MFTRGSVRLDLLYRDTMNSYSGFMLRGTYRLDSRTRLSLKTGMSLDAAESTQLYIAGKKRTFEPTLAYNILPSTLLTFDYAYNVYHSSDDYYIGKGSFFYTNLAKTIKIGYPDLKFAAFYSRGLYEETSSYKGSVDEIQRNPYLVLPIDFYNYGGEVYLGMANAQLYTRVWRPYLQASYYYASDIDDWTYSFDAGYGGKIWHQDHLRFGASYSNFVNGTNGQIFELYINYQFLYHLPK